MTTASAGKDRLEQFKAELRKARLRTLLSLTLVFFSTLLLIMLTSGDRFDHILHYLGLRGVWNEEGGVYADCSKPQNRSIPYCQPKSNDTQKTWNGIEKSGGRYNPFTLYTLDEGK
ncbi:MAG: hypothetical protein J5J00_15720 [Deltaproteobacteria bacterium]|nr:hypothetical protein [Deltaproteobacteria bacterium]